MPTWHHLLGLSISCNWCGVAVTDAKLWRTRVLGRTQAQVGQLLPSTTPATVVSALPAVVEDVHPVALLHRVLLANRVRVCRHGRDDLTCLGVEVSARILAMVAPTRRRRCRCCLPRVIRRAWANYRGFGSGWVPLDMSALASPVLEPVASQKDGRHT
jgi:hypothetical protein